MNKISAADFQRLSAGATVLEADGYGDKVLRLADGSMLKLFRRKRLISSSAWYPYAQRFADNCARLAELGIPCPTVLAVSRVAEIERDIVHYTPLAGMTVREKLNQGIEEPGEGILRARLGEFVAQLHLNGVLFRSLHFGNIVITPEARLGLIDLSDLSVKRRVLGRYAVLRNLRHLMRYASEWAWLDAESVFFASYAEKMQGHGVGFVSFLQQRLRK